MNDINSTIQSLPSQKIIQMIQEFVGCLNYPSTKAILAKEKNKYKNVKNQQANQKQNQMKMEEKKHYRMEMQVEDLNKVRQIQCQMKDENKQQLKKEEQKCKGEMQEQIYKKQQEQQQKKNIFKTEKFTWKDQQAKFYSKFASFSQIVYCLETSSAQRQLADVKFRQRELLSTNNQILQNCINSKPTILQLFSTFDASSKIKQFTVPIYRNLSIQPKFSKPTKFILASPRQNYLCIVDKNSTVTVINLTQLCLIQYIKFDQPEAVTSIIWLRSGTMLAIGTKSGKLNIYAVNQRSMNKAIQQMHPNQGQITAMCCTKQYLYTCGADFIISATSIRCWKVQRTIKLKGNWLKKLVKIDHKKLKDIIFGIDQNGSEIVMIDQVTGFQTTIFSIKKDHAEQCKKACQKKESKFHIRQIIKNCYITDILSNNQNSTLIISVAGINPSIYEMDPLRNEIISRLNYRQLKSQLFPSDLQSISKRLTSNIYMSLCHKSQLLTVTTNSNVIFYIRLKNWRILYEYSEIEKNIVFGQVTATRRYPEIDQSSLISSQIHPSELQQFLPPTLSPHRTMRDANKHNNNNTKPLQKQKQQNNKNRQSIICVHNKSNQNIEIYYDNKAEVKTIRSDNLRTRPFLSSQLGFPTSAQGFLELLQTIRENYQAFV